MVPLNIAIRQKQDGSRKIMVELDADKFERLAANLGFFGDDFLESLARAEKDCEAGRVKKIKSLKELK